MNATAYRLTYLANGKTGTVVLSATPADLDDAIAEALADLGEDVAIIDCTEEES